MHYRTRWRQVRSLRFEHCSPSLGWCQDPTRTPAVRPRIYRRLPTGLMAHCLQSHRAATNDPTFASQLALTIIHTATNDPSPIPPPYRSHERVVARSGGLLDVQKSNHGTTDSQMVPHSGTNEAARSLDLRRADGMLIFLRPMAVDEL